MGFVSDFTDMVEQGPEAAATLAHMNDREIVFKGEGGHVEVVTDGPSQAVSDAAAAERSLGPEQWPALYKEIVERGDPSDSLKHYATL